MFNGTEQVRRLVVYSHFCDVTTDTNSRYMDGINHETKRCFFKNVKENV